MHGVTILWALRSPCNFNCQYCYFGTLESSTVNGEANSGVLNHLSTADVSLSQAIGFIEQLSVGDVSRAFLAGGEPLIWKGTHKVIERLKAKGIQVVVCTNGIPLCQTGMCDYLLDIGVDAVSVSVDSLDSVYNNHWRTYRPGNGLEHVLDGLKLLISRRNHIGSPTKVGVYTVVTRENIDHLHRTYTGLSEIGIDYYIFQPVSLAIDHPLIDILPLTPSHGPLIRDAIESLQRLGINTYLPGSIYIERMLLAINRPWERLVRNCFGGKDLFFIQPDGSVWDCPSSFKIRATPADGHHSILNTPASDLFSNARRSRNSDCCLFSVDCANMWQLMAFDEIIPHD